MRGNIANKSFQILRNSEHGERRSLDVPMGMTAILVTKNLTQGAPRSATHVQDGSLIRSRFVSMNSTHSFQCPGESCTHEHANGARTFVEVWSGQDVSHCSGCTYVSLIPRYSWASIFLFVYIGGITFAPLGSRSVPSSETETQDDYSSDEETLHETREGSAFPSSYVITEPCSPKSAYCLAEKVCPAPLWAVRSSTILSLRLV